jgi:hypothetical protein
MRRPVPRFCLLTSAVLVGFQWALCGCGGGGVIFRISTQPITVSLPIPTVVWVQGGKAVTVPLQIVSTSESAVVSVGGLPAGVSVSYAASDTNPSGTLSFVANESTNPGRYEPLISVLSAGQSASLAFTLIVNAP